MKKRLPLLTGIALSLAIHGGLLVWLVPSPARLPTPRESVTISLAFAPVVPAPLVEPPVESSGAGRGAPRAEPDVLSDPPASPSTPTTEEQSDLIPVEREVSPVHSGPVPDSPGPARKPSPTEPLLPSAIALRQAVREATGTGGADAAAAGCSPLQSRNEILDCATPLPDWQAGGRLNPQTTRVGFAATVARGRAVAGTLASNRSQWLTGLDNADLDERTRRQLTDQLEAGIEVYTGNGNTPLQRLQEQVYRNDPAYQQAQRILNPR